MSLASIASLFEPGRAVAELFSTEDFMRATSLLALLCVAAVVAALLYLRQKTGAAHFSWWAVSWLTYAPCLVLSFNGTHEMRRLLYVAVGGCLGVSALCMFRSNQPMARFVGRSYVAGAVVAAGLGWAAWAVYGLQHFGLALMPAALLLGAGHVLAGVMHFRQNKIRKNNSALLLAIGFGLWGLQCAAFPFLQGRFGSIAVGFLLASVAALFVVLGLIVDTVLTRTEQNYRGLLEAIGDAVFLVDLFTLKVVEANKAAQDLIKRQGQELIDASFLDLCPSLQKWMDQRSDPRKMFSAVFKPYTDFYMLRSDGSMLACEGEAKPVEWCDRTVMQVRMRQLTDRGKVGDLVRRADKMSALGQLVAGVAHELNNPLAVVLGRGQLLARRLNGPDRADLDKILHETERAARIVRDLLTFARPCDPQFTAVDINELVNSVLDSFTQDFAASKIRLEKQLGPALPAAEADAVQIEQVLTNLVKNAIYAMSSKPGQHVLTVATQENGTLVRVSVSDTGPGIPDEIKDKIFDPFFTTKPPGKGTGLGLSICSNVLHDHRGKFWVETSAGKGATFFVELPMSPQPVQSARVRPEKVKGKPVAVPPGLKVLIVDDDPGMLEVLHAIITSLGFAVDDAVNGSEALQKIAGNQYAIILSDICMPEMDGQQLYDAICQKQPALARRIVFVTGDTVGQESREFLDRVGNPWLGKPFNIQLVEDVIDRVLRANPLATKPALTDPVGGPVVSSKTTPPAEKLPGQNPSSAPGAGPSRPRVLVVDDETEIREVIQLTLEGCGYAVDTATNGAEALRKVMMTRYNLVLTDIAMPEMDGTEFYQAVNQVIPDLARRMIFVTEGATNKRARDFLAEVQNQRLSKPFSLAALEQTVSANLQSTVPATERKNTPQFLVAADPGRPALVTSQGEDK